MIQEDHLKPKEVQKQMTPVQELEGLPQTEILTQPIETDKTTSETIQPTPPSPEVGFEVATKKEKPSITIEKEGFLEETIQNMRKKLKIPKKKKKTEIPLIRDKITVEIEQIMQDGLAEAYQELSPIQQQEFKIKGEETARKIKSLLKATHIKVKAIFRLLLEWLKMLPGINRFFLEQEAKIKADKIIALKHINKDGL